MNKLTKEQQELAEKSHNYIYYFCHRYNLDIEEYYDLFAIGLCKAAMKYDPNKKYEFGAYLHKVLYNEYIMHIRYCNSSKRNKYIEVSLEKPIGNDDGKLTLQDTITNNLDTYDECIFLDFSKLNEKQKEIIKLKILGYTQQEISKILNYSQSNISKLLSEARELIN